MIFDKIENINNYGLDFQFIKDNLDTNEFVKGKFESSRPECFGIGLEFDTQNAEDALWEAHRKYLDVHVVLEGEEIISIADISNAKSTKEYEDDYELFEAKPEQQIHMKPGFFLLLYPHEVHRTTEKVEGSVKVRKNVYKCPINE